MAKINGVEMKAIKSFPDHEGCECAYASIYIDGKRVGRWSQDSWGGPDNYEGFEDAIINKAKAFKEGCPKDAEYYDFLDNPDIFMGHLLELSEDEKRYKKYLKDGYTTVLMISDGYHCSMVAYRGKMTLSEIESRFPDTVKKMREGMYKNVKPKERLYTSLDDFSVVVDKKHLVPAYVNID